MSEECADTSAEEGEDKEYGDTGVTTEDVPAEGPVGEGNTQHFIADWNEDQLSALENIVSESEEYDQLHLNMSYGNMEKKISKYMSEHSTDPTTAKEMIEALYQLPLDVAKNAVGITLNKFLVDRENNSMTLGKGDKVMVFLHGWMQNQGAYHNMMKQAKSLGYKVMAMGWDYNDFCKGGSKATNLAKDILQRTGVKPTFIGHSDGAKALMYGAQRHGLDQFTEKFVFLEGDINHSYNRLPGHFLLGGLPASGNLATNEGKKGALYHNSRELEVPVYTVRGKGFGKDDGLTTERSQTYMRSAEIVDIPTSHFGMAGTNQNVNRLILDYADNSGWNNASKDWDKMSRKLNENAFDRAGDSHDLLNFTAGNRSTHVPIKVWYN